MILPCYICERVDFYSLFYQLSIGVNMELKQTNGKASLYRKESYNGRTTAMVEWIVKVGDQVIRYCTTKKEAIIWLDLYKN